MALSKKDRIFIKEFLLDGNLGRAAKAAGSKAKNLSQAGTDLLKKPEVQRELERQTQSKEERLDRLRNKVLDFWENAIDADLTDFYTYDKKKKEITVRDFNKLPLAQRRLLTELTETVTQVGGQIKFKIANKEKVSELLARHLGMLKDTLDITSKGESIKPDSPLNEDEQKELARLRAKVQK